MINTETGEELQGVIQRMSLEEILTLKNDPNFIFDWPSEKENEIYKKLREKYSDEEIAESMLIPQQMTKEEKKNQMKCSEHSGLIF